MKKYFVFGLIILVSFNVSGTFIKDTQKNDVSTDCYNHNIIYVDDDNIDGPWDGSIDRPYRTINSAYNKASDHETIFVFNGLYREDIKTITKSIRILGEDKYNTIVESPRLCRYILLIRCDRVMVQNFTFRNRFDYFSSTNYAIFSSNDSTIITNNIFIDNDYGLWIISSNNIISNNIFLRNEGALRIQGKSNLIFRNHFESNGRGTDGKHGIFIEGKSPRNIIIGNNFINNRKNAYFITSRRSLWFNNYWDDWNGNGPMIINGTVELPVGIGSHNYGFYIIYKEFPIKRLDLHPKQYPYDIEMI